jgi:hypothetical protein
MVDSWVDLSAVERDERWVGSMVFDLVEKLVVAKVVWRGGKLGVAKVVPMVEKLVVWRV